MWLLFGSESSLKRVSGGAKFAHTCPQCRSPATFYECESTSSFSIWGIDLLGDKERVVQCGECLAAFKTDEVPRPVDPKELERIAKEKAKLEKQLLRDKRERDAGIEKRLAELKRKAGK